MSGPVGASVAVLTSFGRARRVAVPACTAIALACSVGVADGREAPPDPVASYAFDEGSGSTSADASGNGHTATLQNVRWTRAGRYGGAVVLKGRKSIARIADAAPLDLSRAMTVEAWVRPSTRAGIRTIIAKRRKHGRGFPYGLQLRGGRLAGFARIGRRSVRAGTRKAARAKRWHFVAATFDGKTIRTHLDGKQVAQRHARGAIAPSDGALQIGAGFRGAIDNVRLYARALSPKQLRADRRADVADDASRPDRGSGHDPAPKPGKTPAPTPSPAPSNGRNCMADASACGYADVESTGVPPGTPLTAASGVVTLSTPGQVYENKLLTGMISVTAPNVTIRNVKLVTTDASYGISTFGWQNNTAGLVVENVEIDLNGRLATKGIAFDNYTARRVFFHNGSDCAHFGNNVVIEDSLCVTGPDTNSDGWPDSTGFCSGPEHFDGFQSDGGANIRLRHNTIRVPCSQTSAILMSTNTSAIRDVTIADNLMAGGGYTLYCNAGPDVPNETVTGNRFARTWYAKSGRWGPTTGCDAADVYAGNIWDDTGATAR
jgi:hypothetical protein